MAIELNEGTVRTPLDDCPKPVDVTTYQLRSIESLNETEVNAMLTKIKEAEKTAASGSQWLEIIRNVIVTGLSFFKP